MDPLTFLNCTSADSLGDDTVAAVCDYLLSSLSRVTGIPFVSQGAYPTIDYFEIRCIHEGNPGFAMCWDGQISRTDYRDDGQYSYGAFLFLYAGTTRLFPDGYCHRYLLFETDDKGVAEWRDLGWQTDDYDEWSDRTLEIES